MKIIRNNYKSKKESNKATRSVICECDKCGSELEVFQEDTHIGWLGAAFVTCPCCGKETMIDDLNGITLTKDNIEFPKHFLRTNSNTVLYEIPDEKITESISDGIEFLRKHKEESYYIASLGDTEIAIYKVYDEQEYYISVSKDKYSTYVLFEEEDY